MTGLAVLLLQTAAVLGFGAALLRVLGLNRELGALEHWVFAFALGFGVLGWAVFPLGVFGLLGTGWLVALLVAGAAGLVFLKRSRPVFPAPDALGWVLWGLIAGVGLLDLLEGLSPPGDADSLAYHFNEPRRFIAAGRIEFVFRAIDGAVPYLIQMTYVPVLALGGERALTLWTTLGGWMPAAGLYVLCRPHLSRNGSLAAALVFLTLPVVAFSGSSGQVELRAALFVIVAAWAVARALSTGEMRYALLAGIAVGFYGGAKYVGLLFALACGLVLLAQRRRFRAGFLYSLAALAAGFQWYLWNGLNTGDPFFPLLFEWLGKDGLSQWTLEQNRLVGAILAHYEQSVPRTFLGFFHYPFHATLDPAPVIDAQRAGLGPFGLLVLPFALLGAWRFRRRIPQSPLGVYAALAFLFYVCWFVGAPSQRVRHLLPVMPLLMVCFTVAARRFADTAGARGALLGAFVLTLAFQFAGQGLVSAKYVRYFAGGRDREAFLNATISHYAPVPWLNAHLGPGDKLLIEERQLLYFLKMPHFFASAHGQSAINLWPGKTDVPTLLAQIRAQGVTHILLRSMPGGKEYGDPYDPLRRAGCLVRLKRFSTVRIVSRTLSAKTGGADTFDLVRLRDGACKG